MCQENAAREAFRQLAQLFASKTKVSILPAQRCGVPLDRLFHVVHVFLVKTWRGDPVESAEMKPVWFKIDEIPFERMWQDGSYWLPFTLAGKRISARFTFKEDNETVDESEIEEWH